MDARETLTDHAPLLERAFTLAVAEYQADRPGRKFFDRVVRVDRPTGCIETHAAPASHHFGGEPCFIPDPAAPGERGVLVCQQFDAQRVISSFVVFDAFALAKGPIGTIALPAPIPLLFDSAFYGSRS